MQGGAAFYLCARTGPSDNPGKVGPFHSIAIIGKVALLPVPVPAPLLHAGRRTDACDYPSGGKTEKPFTCE